MPVLFKSLEKCNKHCVKSVKIRSFFCPFIPVFGLIMEIYAVNLRIQSEYGKIRIRKNSTFGHFSRSEIMQLATHDGQKIEKQQWDLMEQKLT